MIKTATYAFANLEWKPSDFWLVTPFEFWPAQQMFLKKLEAQSK